MSIVFLKGFLFALSLIVAIGAQNAFIIKQALLKRYVFIICLLCFLSDIFLMGIGIFGVGEFLAKNKIFHFILALCGTVFTLFYAYISLKAALIKQVIKEDEINNVNSLKKTIFLTLAFTYLNPQVYLDTILLVGAAALNFNIEEKIFLL
ncbi:LysE/ArgO family amino acid transporter [Campylobacter hepaticus]